VFVFDFDSEIVFVGDAGTYVYLMDASNRCVGTIGFQDPEPEQLEKLRKLLLRAGEGGGK
jgi:hypothetical protein